MVVESLGLVAVAKSKNLPKDPNAFVASWVVGGAKDDILPRVAILYGCFCCCCCCKTEVCPQRRLGFVPERRFVLFECPWNGLPCCGSRYSDIGPHSVQIGQSTGSRA